MKKLFLVLGVCLLMANAADAALVDVALTADTVNSSIGLLNSPSGGDNNYHVGFTLTDGFAYDPSSPTSVLPNQDFSTERLYYSGSQAPDAILGDITLYYSLSEITFAAGDTFVFDFYGRNVATDRDDDVDVALLTGGVGGSVVAETLGNTATGASFHFRTDLSSGLSAGDMFDTIRVINHPSHAAVLPHDDHVNDIGYITVLEVRAAYESVPEPTSFVLISLGLAGMGFVSRRRRKNG